MSDSLKDHHSSISIGDRNISNLRFSDDNDLISGSNYELQLLTDSLAKHTCNYVVKSVLKKSKL